MGHRRRLLHLLAAGPDRLPLRPAEARRAWPGRSCSSSIARSAPVRRRRRRGRPRLPRGPLVAAAVLFDLERLGPAEVRALGGAQRLQAADARGPRRAVPGDPPHRRAGRDRHALRARDRRARPARDQPRGAARRARDGRLRRMRLPQRRLPGRGARLRAAGGDRRRRQERRDRGRLGDRQGDPRPLHAPRRRGASRAGSSPSTSATPRPSTARRSSGSASRRCTGCRSSRRPTSSWPWPASARALRRGRRFRTRPPRCSIPTSRPSRSNVTPIASKRSTSA